MKTLVFLDKKFEQYDEANPHVYHAFKQRALQAWRKGRRRIGAKMLMEVIRWDTMIAGSGDYKINNNYTSRYVRKLLSDCPSLRSLFAIRELKQ